MPAVLTNPTLEKLHTLRLTGMADALSDQLEQPRHYGELEFTARLGLLVDREAIERDNRRLTRNLKSARLRIPACVEDLDFRRPRGLDRTQILHLAQAGWVHEHRDLIVLGPTGVGKTFLACALAHAAIRQGYRALYWRLPRLFDELRLARGDGRLGQLLASWARLDILVLDDLALRPLTTEQAADLLEIIEDRHQRSTIITSQLPVVHWHDALGSEPTLADALCDRLIHTAHRIELRGESLRKPHPPADHPTPTHPPDTTEPVEHHNTPPTTEDQP
jgi:DNA replication protein DnaC